MEFSINRAPNSASQDSDISNDRLRKAIERNRSKQSRREPATARATSPTSRFGNNNPMGNSSVPNEWSSPRPAAASNRRPQATASNFESAQSRFDSLSQRANITPAHARRPAPARAQSAATGPAMGRRSVTGLNQEQQIIEPITRRPRTSPASVKYPTPKKATRKKRRAKLGSVIVQRFVKGAWILSLVLFVRLIFTDGGVIDYYSTNSQLNLKTEEVSSVKQDNTDLENEIFRIKKDKSYQKKLVRDNLGFISKNEYLILFPKQR